VNEVFVDSFDFFAILNPRDTAHARAVHFSGRFAGPMVTTTWVLTEVADGLTRSANRHVFRRLVTSLRASPANRVMPASDELFEKGIALFDARPDKQWSLTDGISFVVMGERGIREALTGDHH
jgi:uncharacterized protein